MLITDSDHPLIANNNIECFKVMVMKNNIFYVCPPGSQNFIIHGIKLDEYYLNETYSTSSNDIEKDYRVDGVIGEGFYHTFCNILSAKEFLDYLQEKIDHPETTRHPELYTIPDGSKLVILNAIIPKGSLYYQGGYKRKNSNEMTYASNKIIYLSLYKH